MKLDKVPVVDAKRRLTIKITASDVKRGATNNPITCAAARACLRQTECTEARVHLGRVYLLIGGKYVRYITPPPLRTEIVAFDRGAKFASGLYTLIPPHPTARLGAAQGSNTGRNRTNKKKRAPYHVVSGVRPHASHGTA